jgi:hypothetical protein
VDRIAELANHIPDREDVALAFDATREPLRFSNWTADIAMKTARHIRGARERTLEES